MYLCIILYIYRERYTYIVIYIYIYIYIAIAARRYPIDCQNSPDEELAGLEKHCRI